MSALAIQKDQVLAVYEKLQKWDFSDVTSFLVNRQGYSQEQALAMQEEYIRFISVCSQHASSLDPVVISDRVDPFWHVHILFTRDYASMAEAVLNRKGAYLHHTPTKTDEDIQALETSYRDRTLMLYFTYFGTPPTDFWPENAMICGGSGCSCSGSGNG